MNPIATTGGNSSGGFLGGSLIDLIGAGSKAYQDIKIFDLQQDLLKAQARQAANFGQVTRESNVNATTASPVVYVPTNAATTPGSDDNNKMLLFIGAAVVGLVLLKKA